ncbi:DUF1835 domain-containing protein [Brevibacillus formosus]|uniref:DUF1835 domain-containing protein n=1 Tax=Brevibacillus formosus TaxID=54913 RepID=UPI003F1BC392
MARYWRYKLVKRGLNLIKTKVNHPYVYFFLEPNIVIVYQIENNNYLTVSDLSEKGEWITFEINHGDDFDSFNHETHKPLVGRGYFITLDDLNNMVEEINKHIQKSRHKLMNEQKHRSKTVSTVHIVSPEYAAGPLRIGLERPKVVIGFPDFLSIGPLWKLDEKIGQKFRNEWLHENINFEHDDYVYMNKFTNTLREIDDISDHVPIYIWYGKNADEQTGLRFILYLLRDKKNDIFIINSTELYQRYIASKAEDQPVFCTGQIESKNLKLIFERTIDGKPLSDKDRKLFNKEWEALTQSKEVLRLWINDEIKEVPENHFDTFILQAVEKLHQEQGNKEYISTARVIGEILQQMDEGIGDFFLEYRIRNLIYSGVLELKGIPKSMRHYSIRLR